MRKDIFREVKIREGFKRDGEERNERVHWLKDGERNWTFLIIVGAFQAGLDGRESGKSVG